MPYASLLNHSPYPHIIQYGQLEANTGMLCFPLFRPCSKDQQCFLSYGPLPNLKLLLFYGVAIPNNPHDAVPLQLQVQLLATAGVLSSFQSFAWSALQCRVQSDEVQQISC